jgi:hypothetical protein
MLAEGYDAAYGQFLDETRNLGFHETLSYNRWQVVFADVSDRGGASLPFNSGAGIISGEPLALTKLFTET